MKKILFFAIIAISILFQACTTVKIESNKQADYNKKIGKIYIIINGAKASNDYCAGLLSGMNKEFTVRHITSDGFVRDPLSLETESDIENKVSTYNPDALLLIKQTEVSNINGNIGEKFELSLIDGQTKKVIWKAVMDITDPYYMTGVDASVKKLIQKMVEDQII